MSNLQSTIFNPCRRQLMLLVWVFCLLGNGTAFSQTQKPAAINPPVVIKVRLGPFDGKNNALLADVKKALALGLRATDSATGAEWNFIRYRLGWRKKEFNDDENTGLRKTIYTYNAVSVFESPKIPASWIKEMTEYLQAGEQILIEEILVQDPKTKKAREVRPVIISVL